MLFEADRGNLGLANLRPWVIHWCSSAAALSVWTPHQRTPWVWTGVVPNQDERDVQRITRDRHGQIQLDGSGRARAAQPAQRRVTRCRLF